VTVAISVGFYSPNTGHSEFDAVGALPGAAGALSNGSGSSLSNLGSSFGSTGGNGSSSSRSSSVGSSGLTPSGQGNGGVSGAAGGGPVNGLGLGKLISSNICFMTCFAVDVHKCPHHRRSLASRPHEAKSYMETPMTIYEEYIQ